MEIEGKAAIITGGGTGVGRATALDLAARGCSVVVNYSRSREDAERTAAECAAKGVFAIPFKADVADDAACREMVEVCIGELGQLDILVQSAGTTVFVPHADLDKVSLEDWQNIFRVNVIAPFQMVRAARGALGSVGLGRGGHGLEHRGHRGHRQLDPVLRIEGGAQQPGRDPRARARAEDPRERRRARARSPAAG